MLGHSLVSKREVFGAVLAVLVGVVVVARAINVPITYDESYSIQIAHIARNPLIANNHPLNTLWLSLAWILPFGDWELGYRLLSLISFGLFSIGVLRLMRGLKSNVVYWLALTTLFASPLLIEFWSLARGYALATAATAWLLSELMFPRATSWSGDRLRVFSPVVIWGLVAFYSNFATLFLVATAWVVFAWHRIPLKSGWPLLRDWIKAVGVPSLLLAPGIVWLVALAFTDKLYYSGEKGLVPDTLRSLLRETTDGFSWIDSYTLSTAWAVAALLLLGSVTSIVSSGVTADSGAGRLQFVVLGTVLLWLTAHYAAGAGYPISRTATFAIVLVVAGIAYAADVLIPGESSSKSGIRKRRSGSIFQTAIGWALAGTLAVLALGTVASLAASWSVTRADSWTFDQDADRAADIVLREGSTPSQWCGFVTPLQAIEFYIEAHGESPPSPTCSADFVGTTYWAVAEGDPIPEGSELKAEFPDSGWNLYRVN